MILLVIYISGAFISMIMMCRTELAKTEAIDEPVAVASICALLALFWPVSLLAIIGMIILKAGNK